MKRLRSMNLVIKASLGAALTVPLLTASPSLVAWGPSAFYPTPMDPLMPGPEQAQQLRVDVPGVVETLRHAHRQSARRKWTDVPLNAAENRPDPGASADASYSAEH